MISSGSKFGQKRERDVTRDYIISSKLINQKLPALRGIQAAITSPIQTIYKLPSKYSEEKRYFQMKPSPYTKEHFSRVVLGGKQKCQ